MLEYIMDSKEKVRILRLFVKRPNWIFSGSEIARSLKIPKVTAFRKLKSLVDAHVVLEYKKGPSTAYKINTENYIVKDLIIPVIESEAELPIKKAHIFSRMKVKPKAIIVFGSAERGEMTPLSDIDIALITDKTGAVEKEAYRIIRPFLDAEGIIFSIHVFNNRDFRRRYASGDPLIREISLGKFIFGYLEKVI